MLLVLPALIDQAKPLPPKPAPVEASLSLGERLLIMRICELLQIPVREIAVSKELGGAPVLLIGKAMDEDVANKLSVGFQGVYPRLGVVDSEGKKFVFTDAPAQ